MAELRLTLATTLSTFCFRPSRDISCIFVGRQALRIKRFFVCCHNRLLLDLCLLCSDYAFAGVLLCQDLGAALLPPFTAMLTHVEQTALVEALCDVEHQLYWGTAARYTPPPLPMAAALIRRDGIDFMHRTPFVSGELLSVPILIITIQGMRPSSTARLHVPDSARNPTFPAWANGAAILTRWLVPRSISEAGSTLDKLHNGVILVCESDAPLVEQVLRGLPFSVVTERTGKIHALAASPHESGCAVTL